MPHVRDSSRYAQSADVHARDGSGLGGSVALVPGTGALPDKLCRRICRDRWRCHGGGAMHLNLAAGYTIIPERRKNASARAIAPVQHHRRWASCRR